MTDQNPLTASLQLLWDGLPTPEKGPKPKLSLEDIVETAIGLADREGLDALSMRRLAQELGVGTMSLYRYVPSKRELMDLMLDAVVGPSPQRARAPEEGWREFLATTARDGRQLYLDHPWALQTNWSRPVMGPNSLADLELFISGVKDLPFSDQEKMNLVSALDSYVLGTAKQELTWLNAASDSGITDEDFWRHQLPALERAMASGRFPTLASLNEDTFDGTWDESFELGLELFLDGVAAMIQRREQQPR